MNAGIVETSARPETVGLPILLARPQVKSANEDFASCLSKSSGKSKEAPQDLHSLRPVTPHAHRLSKDNPSEDDDSSLDANSPQLFKDRSAEKSDSAPGNVIVLPALLIEPAFLQESKGAEPSAKPEFVGEGCGRGAQTGQTGCPSRPESPEGAAQDEIVKEASTSHETQKATPTSGTSLPKDLLKELTPVADDSSLSQPAEIAQGSRLNSEVLSPMEDKTFKSGQPNQATPECNPVPGHKPASGGFEHQRNKQQDHRPGESIASPISGTAVAKEELPMNPAVSEPEVAGGIGQKLPDARRMATFVSNVSGATTNPGTITLGAIQHPAILSPLSTVSAPEKGASRAERVYQAFLPELALVKAVRPDSLSVVLKPDRDTEIFVRVSMQDGQLRAYARCDRGDLGALGAEWVSLQKSLANQGVELGRLNQGSMGGAPENPFSNSNFSDQPQTQHERKRDVEPVFNEKTLGTAMKRALRPSRRLTGSRQLLESWA